MTRFAFYGRVSTEDQQSPDESKAWQLRRSVELIAPAGGQVVAEFFDVGVSRSLPWKRRPEASRLLEAIAGPGRRFDAIVVGEPARAFYGQQFGLTFPVFTHYGVELWVPEVGGRVDPGSEAHDLVMSLFGGMSKGERNRIKMRVRTSMAAQATTGRFLGGRPPYGYELADAGAHPNPAKAKLGQRLHTLEPNPATAPIVERIFAEYLAGRGFYAIAEGLTADGVPSPSAADPARNRHRTGVAWSKSAIRAILRNPRYTGREVWAKQRRDEELVDVDDVALGERRVMRWNDRSAWVWSDEATNPAIITPELFAAAAERMVATARAPQSTPRRRNRTYPLSGLLFCGLCGRRMGGQPNHGHVHYRCRYAAEYALANEVDHPKTVYVRGDRIEAALARWTSRLFAPEHRASTIDQMVAAGAAPEPIDEARLDAARRGLVEADAKLARYRSAIEAGNDPTVIAVWVAEVQAERSQAARVLAAAKPPAPISAAELEELLGGLEDIEERIAEATPEDRQLLWNELGVRLVYRPDRNVVSASLAPQLACANGGVGGGT